jgi:ABC-type transporter lipoprotein component MlaA
LLPYDHVVESAFDPYALVRSVWFQRREYKVHGDGQAPAAEEGVPETPGDDLATPSIPPDQPTASLQEGGQLDIDP